MRGDGTHELGHASYEGRAVRDDLVHQTQHLGLIGPDDACGEDELLGACEPDERRDAHEVGERQAVTERARDRHAERGRRRGDAQVACGGDRETATGRRAADRGDGGLAHGLERAEHVVHAVLVGVRVRGGAEFLELGDVGAGDEGIGRARDDESPRLRVVVDVASDGLERLVHREGHGVPGRGAFERQPQRAVT